MQTSSNDMYVNGEYFTNNPDWDVADAHWKAAVICGLLQKNGLQPADVVEVGCGAGQNLVELSKQYPGIKKLRGYDISPQAVAIATTLAKTSSLENIVYFNEELAADSTVSSDLLLIIDVVEHVDDFYGFLRNMRTKGKHFVMHIPLDLSCRTLLKPHVLLQQRRSVGHIHYFSKEMVEWALADTGYAIIDWVYTKPVVDIEPARSLKRWIKKLLRNAAFAINKDRAVKKWGGYSMMILAK